MSNDLQESGAVGAVIALFAVIALLIGWDVFTDYKEGANWGHMAVEVFVLLIAASGIAFLLLQLFQTKSDLAQAQVETEQWRSESRELIRGLGRAIKRQFGSWNLTKAEAEVGLFLLKGFSHKEIAEIRQTSDRTIREQARAVYRKSGLSGRSALSAFFLEDLLLPWSEEPGDPE